MKFLKIMAVIMTVCLLGSALIACDNGSSEDTTVAETTAATTIDVNLIMIIYGVDRLFDMGRTCLNVTGDISATLCVSSWERKKAAKVK